MDQTSVARIASLSFCDLAGSECSTAFGRCNECIKEAGNINLSLITPDHQNEISCRQLRRDKAQLDQRLKAAEAQTANMICCRMPAPWAVNWIKIHLNHKQ